MLSILMRMQVCFKADSHSIIAIHGHGDHWKTCWTDRVTGIFWLHDLLPDAVCGTGKDIRVLSFGYDNSPMAGTPIKDIAKALREFTKFEAGERGMFLRQSPQNFEKIY